MKTKVAIITADVILSSKKEATERLNLYKNITEGIKFIQSSFDFNFERNRGDEFQMKITKIKEACIIGLLIKLWVKSIDYNTSKQKYDIRMSIGIGEEDFEEETMAESDGEAYHLSGRGLETIKKTKQTFSIDSNDKNKEFLKIESRMLDVFIDKMTAMQSIVLFYKLLDLTENEIAEKLRLSQSTINQHSNAANWSVITEYTNFFEKLYANE
ncbi:hypothetical protein DNC80_10265 [Flavobacterium sp. SOK18b]|uniref:hypothetical protein n=1 Tax=Flavobacterium sp. SOK18b TaxID=797900 RepID=UPI0015F7DB77|nr:hypothetical protein [Flavobacterium sp. SOK18b]MBB1194046.1 hypothetical protein [Flavobacterium sp. SOK18b]